MKNSRFSLGIIILSILMLFLFKGTLLASDIKELWTARYDNGIQNADNEDWAQGMKIDSNGDIFVAGSSYLGNDVFNSFLIKFNHSGDTQWVRTSESRPGGYLNIALDNEGNIYLTGTTISTLTFSYFTVKYDPAGTKLWTATYDTPGDDMPSALAIDSSGNVYVTGTSYRWDIGQSADYATVKYDSNGNQMWVKTHDGFNSYDSAAKIALDSDGNSIVTGTSYEPTNDSDYLTIKYDVNGNMLWMTRYKGYANGQDAPSDLLVDVNGDVYVTGTSYQASGSQDFVTLKYDSVGNEIWSKIYDGGGDDAGSALAIDADDNVYVTGEQGIDGYQSSDYATIKYDAEGNPLWVKRYNGPGNWYDSPADIAVDYYGNVYVTGTTDYGPDMDTADYATLSYDANGNLLWLKRFDGENRNDEAYAIGLDSSANVYVSGLSRISNGSFDAVTVKYGRQNNTPIGGNVTVNLINNVSLNFSSVTSAGDTTITTSTTPPASGGFEVNGVYYDISTTATYSGPITVTLPYNPDTTPDPQTLRLYHYDSNLNTWIDATTSVDTINHTISGTVNSFSWFAVGRPDQVFAGFGQPINADGSSIFKVGQTIPVKFQLKDQNGNFVSNAIAKIYLAKISNGIMGNEQEATSTNSPDAGNTFRYDAADNQYIFNLGTKNLSAGSWNLRVATGDGISHTILISINDK